MGFMCPWETFSDLPEPRQATLSTLLFLNLSRLHPSHPMDLRVYKCSQFHSLMSSAKRLYLNNRTLSCFLTH